MTSTSLESTERTHITDKIDVKRPDFRGVFLRLCPYIVQNVYYVYADLYKRVVFCTCYK